MKYRVEEAKGKIPEWENSEVTLVGCRSKGKELREWNRCCQSLASNQTHLGEHLDTEKKNRTGY